MFINSNRNNSNIEITRILHSSKSLHIAWNKPCFSLTRLNHEISISPRVRWHDASLPRGREYEQTQGKFISRQQTITTSCDNKRARLDPWINGRNLCWYQFVNRCNPDNVSNNSGAISPRHFMRIKRFQILMKFLALRY